MRMCRAQDSMPNDWQTSVQLGVVSPFDMTYVFEVKGMSGDTLCHITTSPQDEHGRDLKVRVATKTGICECRLDLVAGAVRVRVGTSLAKILRRVKPGNIIYAIKKNIAASEYKMQVNTCK